MIVRRNLIHLPFVVKKETKIILVFLVLSALIIGPFAYKYIKEHRHVQKVNNTMAQLADFSNDTTGATSTQKKCSVELGFLSEDKTWCNYESVINFRYDPSLRKETVEKLNAWLLTKDLRGSSPSLLTCVGVRNGRQEGNDLNKILDACNPRGYEEFLNEAITPVNQFEYRADEGYNFTLVDRPEVEITIYRTNIVIRVSSERMWEIFT